MTDLLSKLSALTGPDALEGRWATKEELQAMRRSDKARSAEYKAAVSGHTT